MRPSPFLRLPFCPLKIILIVARLHISCQYILKYGRDLNYPYKPSFDEPSSSSLVQFEVALLGDRILSSINLLEVLLYSCKFRENGMFTRINAIEPEIC